MQLVAESRIAEEDLDVGVLSDHTPLTKQTSVGLLRRRLNGYAYRAPVLDVGVQSDDAVGGGRDELGRI